ncbi:MAG: DUF6602 domain-containing protein [Marinifilaceae bacterium]
MIKTISDFLLKLIDAEKQHIDSMEISHRVTIGNMYEGLTKDFLEMSLFDELNLNIVTNSFIINKEGLRSKEMDILIIEGEGNKLPYTDQYDVNIKQVIAVIQVKKKLNKKSIIDGYENLRNVLEIADDIQYEDYHRNLFYDSYLSICNENIMDNGALRKHFDSSTKEAIFRILREEVTMPPRILLGYEGYSSEKNLRDGFVNFLFENLSTADKLISGFSPLHFPNLIINEKISVIKNNAMPFVGSLINGVWPFYTTNTDNPIYNMLEIIWTRISYKYNISSDIFGEDLTLSGANVFLLGNIVNCGGQLGWNFHYEVISKDTLTREYPLEEWQPTKLTMEQHHIIAYLCKNNKILVTKVNTELAKINCNVKIDEFVKSIIETRLVGIDGRKYLRLQTKKCQCAIFKGEFFASDDKSGQFTRWASKTFGDNVLDLRKKV